MKSNAIIHASYIDTELEKKLEATKTIQKEVLGTKAKLEGPVNGPLSFKHYYIGIYSPLKTELQGLLNENFHKTQPVSGTAIAQKTRQQLDEDTAELSRQDNNAQITKAQLKAEQKALKLSRFKTFLFKLKQLIPVILGFLEMLVLTVQFSSTSLPFVVILVLGLVFGTLVSLALQSAAKYIKRAKSSAEERKRYMQVLTIAFVCSILLGIGRYLMYSTVADLDAKVALADSGNSDSTVGVVIVFIIFSLALFISSLSLLVNGNLANDELAKIQSYKALQKQIQDLEVQQKNLRIQREKLRNHHTHVSALHARKLEYAASFEIRVQTLGIDLLQHYEAVNIANRTDDAIPEFFGKNQSLELKTFFNRAFKKTNYE